MDVDEIISGLEKLDRDDLVRVEAALRHRLQNLEVNSLDNTGESQPVSGVVEYRPHADGTLQKEVRRYYRKDGTPKEQGPYWYFRYHEGGKQKKLYLGKTDDPEGTLADKRVNYQGKALRHGDQ